MSDEWQVLGFALKKKDWKCRKDVRTLINAKTTEELIH